MLLAPPHCCAAEESLRRVSSGVPALAGWPVESSGGSHEGKFNYDK